MIRSCHDLESPHGHTQHHMPQPFEGSQGPVYQSLQWANLNEHVSLQAKVICLFRDNCM